jgi:hypothetical protein
MDILKEVQKFESDFIKAGELAVELRESMIASQKQDTGFAEADIVTSADLAVQEYVLKRLADSPLVTCELIAEEDTPSVNLFANHSNYVLSIDPIDGTKIFADGNKMFSIVITITDKKEPIYTFCYYPEVKWGIKIVNDQLEYLGTKPEIKTLDIPVKTIGYWNRPGKQGPHKVDPKLSKELEKQGYSFVGKDEISDETGIKSQFLLGKISGIFLEHDSAVDCLTEYHFAKANKFKIFGWFDLSKTVDNPRGGESRHYEGHYFALRD